MLRSCLYLQKKNLYGIYAITDHTKSLKLANGFDEKQILDQANKIAEINDKIKMNQHIQDQKIIKLIMTVLT